MSVWLPAALALVVAATEAALGVLGRERLRELEQPWAARLTAILARREHVHQSLRATEQLLLAATVLASGEWWSVPLLVVADLLARAVAVAAPEPVAARCWRVADLVWRLSRPLLLLASDEPEPDDSGDDEPDEAVLEVAEAADVDPERRQRIADILDFDDQTLEAVMTARVDMVGVAGEATVAEASRRVTESGRSRLLVFGHSPDEVVGVVHARDLLRAADRARPVRDLARAPLFLAASARLGRALRELRRRHSSLAVVVDEYGGTAGLVTIEDLVEEIVGEIHDESDPPAEPGLQPRAEGGWLAPGRLELDELWDALAVEPPDLPDCHTLGGLVFVLAGDLPTAGEALVLSTSSGRLWLLVTALDGRRVAEVAVVVVAADRQEELAEAEANSAAPAAERVDHDAAAGWPGSWSLSTAEARLEYDEGMGGQVACAELFSFWPAGEKLGREVVWRRHRARVVAELGERLEISWQPASKQAAP